MLSSKSSLKSLVALATFASAQSQAQAIIADTGHKINGSTVPKLKPYVPQMKTASDIEIAEWNAKVKQRNKRKSK